MSVYYHDYMIINYGSYQYVLTIRATLSTASNTTEGTDNNRRGICICQNIHSGYIVPSKHQDTLTGKSPKGLSLCFNVVLSIVRCCLSIHGRCLAHGEEISRVQDSVCTYKYIRRQEYSQWQIPCPQNIHEVHPMLNSKVRVS